ncbi:MAG TPA: hypothetical protein VFF69_04435 [Phycisphaerales bacterium]|nr:hypothetical protein [Phycisphaerales bacterium]
MAETDPYKPESERGRDPGASAGGLGGDPIPLEPSEPEPVRAPPPARARIDSPGLLDDFDEDADLESDPEVDRIVKGIPVQSRPAAPAAAELVGAEPAGEPLSASGAWRLPVGIGGAATIGAAVFAGINGANVAWAHVLNVIYQAGMHTATGLGAVFAAGLLLGRPVGRYDGAAARMFMAVAVFLLVHSVDIPLTAGKLEETLLGGAAYFGALVLSFRLPPRDAAAIGGVHFGIALVAHFGSMLAAVISGAGTTP